jgi:hypothetical protein
MLSASAASAAASAASAWLEAQPAVRSVAAVLRCCRPTSIEARVPDSATAKLCPCRFAKQHGFGISDRDVQALLWQEGRLCASASGKAVACPLKPEYNR